jgi:hypothetical protein
MSIRVKGYKSTRVKECKRFLWSIFLVVSLLFSLFAAVPDVQACGGWWDPCCPWWDKASWDLSCYPDWEREQIQQQEEQQRLPPKVVQSPEQKQRTKKWVERIDQATIYVDSLAAVSAVYCAASNESDMCANARLYINIAVGMRVARWWINLTDPFDPLYAEPYDPPFPDLGLSCENDFGCWINERLGSVVQFWDGVYTSMNRSQSCLDLGLDDCFQWQKERMLWFIWAAGYHLEEVAYGMSMLADYLTDAELVSYARATSEELYVVADEMRQECPQC